MYKQRATKAHSERRSIQVPNLADKLSTAEDQCLNQFGLAAQVLSGKEYWIQQGLSHYATLEQRLIHMRSPHIRA